MKKKRGIVAFGAVVSNYIKRLVGWLIEVIDHSRSGCSFDVKTAKGQDGIWEYLECKHCGKTTGYQLRTRELPSSCYRAIWDNIDEVSVK